LAEVKKTAEKKKKKMTSAEKQAKQSEKRRIRNKAVRTHLKTSLKRLRALGSRKEAEAALAQVYSALDKARKQGNIHARTASRQKSRIALAVAKLP
jgi:small subunit ribosomal protein S20